ncbi:MAG: hypothetical protein ACFCUG_09130 [Thiotrichales bacterium]
MPRRHRSLAVRARYALGRVGYSAWLGLALAAPPAVAAEVDSYTRRPPSLPDATEILNAEVNRRIDRAIAFANAEPHAAEPKRCDTERLLAGLEDLFGGLVFGEIERYANALPQRFRHDTPLAQSIYQDLSLVEAPTLVTYGALAGLIQVHGVLIGTDKLGHFFSDGQTYFRRYHQQGLPIADTLLGGEISELSVFGSMVTGIFSYADLVANFQGMRFWNRVLGEAPDILSQRRPHPYIACANGRLQRTHDFDWRDYVDPAWDEAVNCNRYSNPTILSKTLWRQHETGAGSACRHEQRLLAPLRERYGRYANRLLNGRAEVVERRLLDAIGEFLGRRQPRIETDEHDPGCCPPG